MTPIEMRHYKFANEFCVDFNATQAYMRVYGPDVTIETANVNGSKLLASAKVQARIEERKREMAARLMVTDDWILTQMTLLASADPNELVELRQRKCSNCWKSTEDLETWEMLGFNVKKDIDPECETCDGGGVTVTVPKDTRKLSAAGLRLYKGIKMTKDGPQVLMHDQQAAIKWLSDFKGLAPVRSEISGPGGAPLTTVALKPEDLSDEQLASFLSQS